MPCAGSVRETGLSGSQRGFGGWAREFDRGLFVWRGVEARVKKVLAFGDVVFVCGAVGASLGEWKFGGMVGAAETPWMRATEEQRSGVMARQCVAVFASALCVSCAWAGPISITSRTGMVSGSVLDLSGPGGFLGTAPAGIGDFVLHGDDLTPGVLSSVAADLTTAFTMDSIEALGGGESFSLVPFGGYDAAAKAELHVFFDLLTDATVSWDFFAVFLAPTATIDVVLKEAGGAVIGTGVHSLSAGSYEIHATAMFDALGLPPGVVFSAHYGLALHVIPLPAPALLACAGLGVVCARRRR